VLHLFDVAVHEAAEEAYFIFKVGSEVEAELDTVANVKNVVVQGFLSEAQLLSSIFTSLFLELFHNLSRRRVMDLLPPGLLVPLRHHLDDLAESLDLVLAELPPLPLLENRLRGVIYR